MAHGPCDPARSSSSTGRCRTSRTTRAAIPTCRCWCACGKTAIAGFPTAICGRVILPDAPASDRADWKTVAAAEDTGDLVAPQGSIGYRWPAEDEAKGRWNLEQKDGETGEDVRLALSADRSP